VSDQVSGNCSKPNPAGEAYCYSCGHILPDGLKALVTHSLPDDQTLKPQIRWGTAYFGDQMVLRIHIHDTDKTIEAHFEHECVLGRAVDDVVPEVDLTPYKGIEMGVSRRHVKLTRQSATVMVQDLGSVNGTYLNGQRLLPYQPRVLRTEDELSLGRLVLHISFLQAPHVEKK